MVKAVVAGKEDVTGTGETETEATGAVAEAISRVTITAMTWYRHRRLEPLSDPPSKVM